MIDTLARQIRRVALVLVVLLRSVQDCGADIGLVVMEPIKTLGFLTRVGHSGTYLSNICPDGSPIRMRLCRPGEPGGVVCKYSTIGEHNNYDWAIVPLEQFLNGVDSPELAALIATPELQRTLEAHSFEGVFSTALDRTAGGGLPGGRWRSGLANRLNRGIYILSVVTTSADDRAIMAAFNSAPNKSRFNYFYDNCSNQTKGVFDLIMSGTEAIGDRASGLSMQTPKALAKTLVDRGTERPVLQLRIRRYTQVPGTLPRSTEILFPMENTYRNISFAPYWFFGGFREAALGAMLYHQVFSPFRLAGAYRDFLSAEAGTLTMEQTHLRGLQDEVRRSLQSCRTGGDPRRFEQELLSAEIYRRLRAIKAEKKAEVCRVLGSEAQWRQYDREFRSMVNQASLCGGLPTQLNRHFVDFEPNGQLSERLLAHLEANGHFYVDERARGPWIRLRGLGPEPEATGLSESQILAGNHHLAFLVLAAVIDANLYGSEDRRADIEQMGRFFSLLRQARRALAAPVAAQ